MGPSTQSLADRNQTASSNPANPLQPRQRPQSQTHVQASRHRRLGRVDAKQPGASLVNDAVTEVAHRGYSALLQPVHGGYSAISVTVAPHLEMGRRPRQPALPGKVDRASGCGLIGGKDTGAASALPIWYFGGLCFVRINHWQRPRAGLPGNRIQGAWR